jgi:hypothetical protein
VCYSLDLRRDPSGSRTEPFIVPTHSTRPRPLRHRRGLLASLGLGLLAVVTPVHADTSVREVLAELNATDSVRATDDAKSWPIIFDAWMEASDPPRAIGDDFNFITIHHRMDGWDEVKAWAESNGPLADAIIEASKKTLFGLPYGENEVPARYRDAGITASVAPGGDLRIVEFPWLDQMNGVVAFATAEIYRRLEAGRVDEGLELAVATTFVLRQCCDREFRDEQYYMISMLSGHLENLRDVFHVFFDRISSDQFADIARNQLPFLRPDRGRLLMPEGDKVVARALIESVFDDRGQADREAFADTFSRIQAQEEPLTLFGAARRWKIVADVHDSLESSLERLDLVYDDWWRRWRVQEYDPILDIPTQWARTNEIRYAAVLYSIGDVQELFPVRDYLVAATNGTISAAGVCSYRKRFGDYARNQQNMYALSMRSRHDSDPYKRDFDRFGYRVLSAETPLDTGFGRVMLPAGTGLLWSLGPDREDGRGAVHSAVFEATGNDADIVFWPPVKALQREQGLRD